MTEVVHKRIENIDLKGCILRVNLKSESFLAFYRLKFNSRFKKLVCKINFNPFFLIINLH
jgi:hypothetical protein